MSFFYFLMNYGIVCVKSIFFFGLNFRLTHIINGFISIMIKKQRSVFLVKMPHHFILSSFYTKNWTREFNIWHLTIKRTHTHTHTRTHGCTQRWIEQQRQPITVSMHSTGTEQTGNIIFWHRHRDAIRVCVWLRSSTQTQARASSISEIRLYVYCICTHLTRTHVITWPNN